MLLTQDIFEDIIFKERSAAITCIDSHMLKTGVKYLSKEEIDSVKEEHHRKEEKHGRS